MQVYHKLKDFTQKYPRISVALGMFDGVHIGHQSIIRRAVELARKVHGTSAVFTFSNHPLSVLSPEHMPLQIGTEALKEQQACELGVDLFVCIPFTRDFAQRTPEEFLALLRDDFAPRYVVTGPNYTFGQKGRGTHRQLLREGADYGFHAEICPAVLRGGRPVSSTRIRALIADGNLDEANDFLGHPFRLVERVIHGDRRGRTIGFPTANLPIQPQAAMLPNGAYAVRGRPLVRRHGEHRRQPDICRLHPPRRSQHRRFLRRPLRPRHRRRFPHKAPRRTNLRQR